MDTPPRKFVPEPFTYHQEIELTIDNLSNQGHGVGRVDNWVVFVPYTLPGEKVRARVYRNEKNCSMADLVEVLEPSELRVKPLCPVYGYCGGCPAASRMERSSFRSPQETGLQPMARTPRAAKSRNKAHTTCVLPTPTSVPVTK